MPTIDADVHPELGPRIAVHEPNYAYTVRRVLGGTVSASAGIVFGLIGLKVIRLPRDEFWETVSAFAIAGILLAFGLYFAIDAVRMTGPRVVVYDRGFVAGSEIYRWEQIPVLYMLGAELNISGVPLSLTEYRVHRDDGCVVHFTRGVCDAEQLAVQIQQRIQPRLLAAARAAFAAGRKVDFGDAAIDAEGLTFSDVVSGQTRKLRWSEISRLDGGGAQVHVHMPNESRLARLAGSGKSIATRKVANVTVFLALVTEILAARESRY